MKAERILVPLDGSPLAEIALPKAVELLSEAPGATLILLRAVEACTLPGVGAIEAQVTLVQDAETYLSAVADRINEKGIPRVVRSVWYSGAADAIVEAARLRRVDMIVMSTHGRSGLRRVLRGSVAESVLRRTRTPILLVSAGDNGAVRPPAETAAADSDRRAATEKVMSPAGPSGRPGVGGRHLDGGG